jgi:hypothetical protein
LSDTAEIDLVLISSTVVSGELTNRFFDLPIPVIVWESYLYDDMMMTPPDAGNLQIPLNSLPAGVYILRVNSRENSSFRKFIIR